MHRFTLAQRVEVIQKYRYIWYIRFQQVKEMLDAVNWYISESDKVTNDIYLPKYSILFTVS